MQKTATRTEDTQTQKYTVKIIFYRLKKSEKIDQQNPRGSQVRVPVNQGKLLKHQRTANMCWKTSGKRSYRNQTASHIGAECVV